VPCPGGRDCTWQDFEINYQTCTGAIRGFRFRLIRPGFSGKVNPPTVPVLLAFPGTGSCYTADAAPEEEHAVHAAEGVVVAALSLRGHALCYGAESPLYRSSTWIGPDEVGDYDRLLWAFIQGWVAADLPRGNPARLGVTGGSHGGVTSFVFGRHTRLPGRTGQKIAAVMPAGSTPDTDEWFVAGLDPAEAAQRQLTTWGSVRLSGFPAQMAMYRGPFLESVAADIEADVVRPVRLAEAAWRSAHDAPGSTADYRNRVDATLIFMGSQDCIIPKRGAFRFYAELRAAGAGERARLVSPLAYHGCEGQDGYQPMWTPEAKARISRWRAELHHRWVRRFMLDDPSVDIATWPEWMYMLADEADEPGETPAVYAAAAPGELPVSMRTIPLPAAQWTLVHDPGSCTKLSLAAPCADLTGSQVVALESPPLTEDVVVVGSPRLIIFAREATEARYAFTAILAEVPRPTTDPSLVWPVTSERRFSATAGTAVRRHAVDLDQVVHRFSKGSVIRLVLTTLSPRVTNASRPHTMFAPRTNRFELTFLAENGGEQARIELPVMSEAPQKAGLSWQVQSSPIR